MRILLLTLLLAAPPSLACGTTEEQFERYWRLDSNQAKQDWLQQLDCNGMVNYYPRQADPAIMGVISDAIERGLSREVLENTLDTYHCLYGERNRKGYDALRDYLGDRYTVLCPDEDMAQLYLVDALSGVNLRAGPSSDSERVAGLLPGIQVRVLAEQNEWRRVIIAEEVEGWIYAPLLSAY